MELTEEQREYLRPAMEIYELYEQQKVWIGNNAMTLRVTEVRRELGMQTVKHFSSCFDCIYNYYKDIYKIWKANQQ